MRYVLAPFNYVLGNSGFGLGGVLILGGGFSIRGKGLDLSHVQNARTIKCIASVYDSEAW